MIRQVGVIGSGTMGSGIAQVAATSDCLVNIYDNKKGWMRMRRTVY